MEYIPFLYVSVGLLDEYSQNIPNIPFFKKQWNITLNIPVEYSMEYSKLIILIILIVIVGNIVEIHI